MPSDEVARGVARKLRYYMQVERLEEGFDLSGPEVPRRHYEVKRRPPLYSGTTLHDKSVKFYFHDASIKHFLRDLSPAPARKAPKSDKRRREHVNDLEHYMAQTEFREPFDSKPIGNRPSNLAYKTNVKRPRPKSAFPSGLSTLRRTAPVAVSPLEAHRLVNTAARLLVATETVAFNSGALNRSSSAKRNNEQPDSLRLPNVVDNKKKKAKRRNSKRKPTKPQETLTIEELETAVSKIEPIEENEIQAKHEESVKVDQKYKILVYTGSKRGLNPDVSVKLKIFGENLVTSWIKLTDSLSNDVKFQPSQKDVFSMETEDLGKLNAVSIGHNKAAPGCNWYLNKIEIQDKRAGKLYTFNYYDYVPHSKTTAIGMAEVKLTSVKDSDVYAVETQTPRSLEDHTSQVSASSMSSSSVPKRRPQKRKSRTPTKSLSKSSSRKSSVSSLSSSSRSRSPGADKDTLDDKKIQGSSKSEEAMDVESIVEEEETKPVLKEPETWSSESKSPSPTPPKSDSTSTTASSSRTETPIPPDPTVVIAEPALKEPETSSTESKSPSPTPPKSDSTSTSSSRSETPVPPEPTVVITEPEPPSPREPPTPPPEPVEVIAVPMPALPPPPEYHKRIWKEEEEANDDWMPTFKTEPPAAEPIVSVDGEAEVADSDNEEEEKDEGQEKVTPETEAEVGPKLAVHKSSMSSEEGFLEELNLIKNPKFSEQDKQPEFWVQFGGCSLSCIEVTVPWSDNKYACLVHSRSAKFAGVAQNIVSRIVNRARYKITAQVRLADSSGLSSSDKICCTLHYRLASEPSFQQLLIAEVTNVKCSTWSYIVGWIELEKLQTGNVSFSAMRLCFDGPESDHDFLVADVVVRQEHGDENARKLNVVTNGTFDQFILSPLHWKGVGQATIALSDMFHNKKQGCMTLDRPFAYSGIAQSVLDVVEQERHYAFTVYVRIVQEGSDDANKGHTVRWMLKYNTGDTNGDLSYEIGKADDVTSSDWTKMSGELNMTELKTSTGRPVLTSPLHKSGKAKSKDVFGQPLEYCTFHLETTAKVNLCVAGPRMIEGGKILKPSDKQKQGGIVKEEQRWSSSGEESSSVSRKSSRYSSSSSSDSENEEEKKDSEKASEVDAVEAAESISKKQREQQQLLKKLHHAIEVGNRDEVMEILKKDDSVVNVPEPVMSFTTAHQAVIHRRGQYLKLLDDHGCDFNAVSKAGFMPIHYAAWNNDVECLEHLFTVGATLNEITTDRHTPLHIAAMRGNKEAVKWLMISGCVLNYRDIQDRTPADLASLNDFDSIAALISKCVGRLKQHLDIVEVINDTDLSAPVSPMSSLTANGPEVLDSLPEQVKTNETVVSGLHAAIARNDQKLVNEILKDMPYAVNLPSKRGETAIHVATSHKHPNLIKLLSSLGSELSTPTRSGYMPFHQAVMNNDIESLNTLYSLDVDIDAKTPDHQTGLHLAAERGLVPAVKWLIEHGAVLNFRNSSRKTPADLALDKGYPKIAELIRLCVEKLKQDEDVADVLKTFADH